VLKLLKMLWFRKNLGRVLVSLVRVTSVEVEEEEKVYFLYRHVPTYIPIYVPIDVDEEEEVYFYIEKTFYRKNIL
jgi:hypothetical protein